MIHADDNPHSDSYTAGEARAMREAQAKTPRLPRLRERDLQQHIRAALTHVGYSSLETGVPKRKTACPKCRHPFTPTGGNNSRGVPDLLVWRDGWPEGVLLGLEVKGQDTAVSDAQKALAASCRVVIVRSIRDALLALRGWEGRGGEGSARQWARIDDYLTMNDGRI